MTKRVCINVIRQTDSNFQKSLTLIQLPMSLYVSKLLVAVFVLLWSYQGIAQKTCISKEEKKLHELINNYRKKQKLDVVALSPKLTKVAQLHARDLNDNYTPNDKCNPHSWSDHGDWTPCCYTNDHQDPNCMWSKPGEIANYQSAGFEIAFWSTAGANATDAMAGWKKSKSHNPVIVNEGTWKQIEWKAMGVGIYGEYAVVWFGGLPDEEEIGICN